MEAAKLDSFLLRKNVNEFFFAKQKLILKNKSSLQIQTG